MGTQATIGQLAGWHLKVGCCCISFGVFCCVPVSNISDIKIFGGKIHPEDVFAGRSLGMITPPATVKEQQLSMYWGGFRTASEASHALGLKGLEWLSTSHPDQLAF